MNSRIRLKAYAKVNLFLDITGILPNGYHSLNSVMQQLELADDVEIKVSDGDEIKIRCDNPDIPAGDNNIAYKAAALFLETSGLKAAVEILIEKHIPIEAGLGGSSADGAAVLLGMNRIFGFPVEMRKLVELGGKLGADVPFCMTGGTRICTGIGTTLNLVKSLPECFFVIIKPDFSNNTKEAYKIYDLSEKRVTADFNAFLSALKSGSLDKTSEKLFNVFEKLYDDGRIRCIKEELIKAGALGVSMTGSGSAVFGIFSDEISAKNAQIRLPFPMKIITKGLDGVEMSGKLC